MKRSSAFFDINGLMDTESSPAQKRQRFDSLDTQPEWDEEEQYEQFCAFEEAYEAEIEREVNFVLSGVVSAVCRLGLVMGW